MEQHHPGLLEKFHPAQHSIQVPPCMVCRGHPPPGALWCTTEEVVRKPALWHLEETEILLLRQEEWQGGLQEEVGLLQVRG